MVSIIVPVYNAENSISRCIESLINQTFIDIEIILVDDGSTDQTGYICKKYASEDQRIKYYCKANGGAATARNFGLKKAKGEYIQFVDSDDFVDVNITKTLFRALIESNVDWVICGFKAVGFRKTQIIQFGNRMCDTKEEIVELLYQYYASSIINSCCNKLYKKRLIQELMPENYIFGEDYIFNLHYLLCCHSIRTISDVLYLYDCTGLSVTRGLGKNELWVYVEQYKTSRELLKVFFNDNSLDKLIIYSYFQQIISYIISSRKFLSINEKTIKTSLAFLENDIGVLESKDRLVEALQNKRYKAICRYIRGKQLKLFPKYILIRFLTKWKIHF